MKASMRKGRFGALLNDTGACVVEATKPDCSENSTGPPCGHFSKVGISTLLARSIGLSDGQAGFLIEYKGAFAEDDLPLGSFLGLGGSVYLEPIPDD